jgi:predicted transcriptional regulator
MATVRVDSKLHETLRALSEAEHRSISQVIEVAIDRYQQENFWKAMHEGFARLRADPDAWRDYQDEAALWDSVSGDGLEDEEPYFTDEEARDEVAATATHR